MPPKQDNEFQKVKIPDKAFKLIMPDAKTGGCSILMVGSTRSGKSTALEHILDTYFKKHVGVLFSQSIKANAYKTMNYPNIAKAGCYIPELIHDMYGINKDTENHYPFLSIIDDCPLVRSDKELLKLTTIYRNSGLSSIVCCQNLGMLNPTCRSNINFVMLFFLNNTEAIEKTIKVFLRGYLPQGWNYDKKIEWYKATTSDHHFLLIDNLNGTIQRCKIDL
jgi:hypothetical protein